MSTDDEGQGPPRNPPGRFKKLAGQYDRIAKLAIDDAQAQTSGQAKEAEAIARSVVSEMFQRGANYTNLITIGGYAGIFTLFHLMRSYLPREWALAIAILLGFSILIFSLAEIFKMLDWSWMTRTLAKKLDDGLDSQAKARAYQAVARRFDQRHAKLWPWHFGATALTGLSAGIILVIWFVIEAA